MIVNKERTMSREMLMVQSKGLHFRRILPLASNEMGEKIAECSNCPKKLLKQQMTSADCVKRTNPGSMEPLR
jgi:hypothetical protein